MNNRVSGVRERNGEKEQGGMRVYCGGKQAEEKNKDYPEND